MFKSLSSKPALTIVEAAKFPVRLSVVTDLFNKYFREEPGKPIIIPPFLEKIKNSIELEAK